MNDKQIKEQIERLDALSGGIVYGREEAWDKLQARLDHKPRKVLLWHSIAAAAVLLLCVAAYYSIQPEEKIAQNQPLSTPASHGTESTVVTVPETQLVKQDATELKTITTHRQKKTNPEKTTVIQQPIIAIHAADTTSIKHEIVATSPKQSPVIPVKPMRVVHINDLGKEETSTPAVAYNGPSLDISKMKVVSIYELQHQELMHSQEEELITIVRINRPHGVLFGIPNYRGRNNGVLSQNPLSLRLNRNN
jgi:hypothetical protein